MIEAEVVVERAAEPRPPTPGVVRIKAQPSADGRECKLMLDRVLLERYSWCFDDPEQGAGSPLASALLALDSVGQVIVDGSTLIMVSADEYGARWKELAPRAGAIVREHVLAGSVVVPPELLVGIPPEDETRAAIEAVIEDEINPGIAAHDGVISLVGITGNTVTIEMGGGCQGCSAASITLRSGIFGVFRDAAPHIGAIYDATDHTAGTNPFFS